MAISRDKAIVIGVVVLGALSFLVYRQAKHDQELGSADRMTAAIVPSAVPEGHSNPVEQLSRRLRALASR